MAAGLSRDERAIFKELSTLLGDSEKVLMGLPARMTYDADSYTVERAIPSAIVFPETTDEVQRLVRWCVRKGIAYVARGAGTGLSGGTLPPHGGLVITLKRMNRILAVDIENRQIHAQAGVVNIRLTEAVKAHGLHFAPDPSSQTVATLAGNIAENSGGPHTLKYGVTAPHILRVTMVDARGEVVSLGRRTEAGPGLDLLGLVIGSEGTVGIITEAWVRVVPVAPAVKTALAAFSTPRDATEAVAEVIAAGVVPAALEMMDKNILGALHDAFGLQFPEGTQALLLIECDGQPEAVEAEAAEVARIMESNGAIDVHVAKDETERTRLWIARKKGVGALGRVAPSKVTHDGVIPRSRLPEVLDYVYEVAEEFGVYVANLFHAGDGNLHPIFCFDDRDPKQIENVVAAGHKIAAKCVEVGGSVTGEHGVGVEKSSLLKVMYSEDDLKLQKDVRDIFDPGPNCNPGKILPDQKGYGHMHTSRGLNR